jgi:DNA invertase Pin-like site-specific DNA recombinase
MTAVAYIRVSTARQVEQGSSLEAQQARVRQFCSFKGFDLVEVVSDEGMSGKSTDRPGYQRVLDMVRSRSVDAVVVYSLSRFARNTVATLDAVELMNRRGVTFCSLTEQIDTSTPVGRFFVTTLAALAQLEREQIGERTRTVLQHKRSVGERVGQIPFGQRLVDGKLVTDEVEQQVIALVKDLRAGGMTYDAIAGELTRRGVVNKGGSVRWYKSQVHTLAHKAA